jgi:septum formation protein
MSCGLLILASGSPRRRELLEELGLKFQVITADVEELDQKSAPELSAADLARANARSKAEAVARLNPGRWVLGADTVVALEGRIFGKPRTAEEAREFLRALSGRTHRVVTACVLQHPEGGADFLDDEAAVTFLPLAEEIITRYLAAVDVMDKAGAYALQERGDWIISRIEGSRTAVIGLPVEKLSALLQSRGLLSAA